MNIYNEIPIGLSDPTNCADQKKLEHELICMMQSYKPDKEKIKELKRELKKLKKLKSIE